MSLLRAAAALLVVGLLVLGLLAGCATTPERDLQHERLAAALAALESDPALGEFASTERLQARQAIDRLRSDTDRSARQANVYLAERRVEIARAAAQAELATRQLEQLERERDRILLDAARRDAELSRLEAEKSRLQSMARAEEAQRAFEEADAARRMSELSSAEAEQARRLAQAQATEATLARRETELALAAADSLRAQLQSMTARREARGEVMTLSGDAFASGQSQLRPEARDNLDQVVAFLARHPERQVLVEGHTDSRGSANLNQVLSQRRAESVLRALVEDGIAAERLSAVGRGMEQPIADNASAEGRARNRRVDIVLLD
jgi:outer membrane protein OmpA-like peptidoglycan-associated protein